MKIQMRAVFIFGIIFFVSMLLLGVTSANGETYLPPVPDPNKTIPANNGGPAR